MEDGYHSPFTIQALWRDERKTGMDTEKIGA